MKENAFLSFLEKGLNIHSKKETEKTLGDRSTYIGGSDLGACPRKTILSKIIQTQLTLKECVIFSRGHIAETIIANGLNANKVKFSTQVRAESKTKPYMKAHLDFLVHTKTEDIMLEVKSVSTMPTTPRESWILQVQYGLGLLRENGVNCQRGYIVCFNVNSGETREFPFVFNEEIYKLAVNRAEVLYKLLINKDESVCETSPLCSYCNYSSSCQYYGKGAVAMSSDIDEELQSYVDAVAKWKEAEEHKKQRESVLLNFMQSAEISKLKTKDKTIVLQKRAGRELLDISQLKKDHPEICQSYTKKSADSVYISVI